MKTRQIEFYKVCHPYKLSESVRGYWNGKFWSFKELGIYSLFDDDDLNWINENIIKQKP